MNQNKDELFQRIFGSNENDNQPLIDDRDRLLAAFIYDVAWEEFAQHPEDLGDKSDDDDDGSDDNADDDVNADSFSVLSFEDKVEATKENFERIVELFNKTTKAKGTFLKNFEKWAPGCKTHIQLLRETAESIHTDKFNSDIAKLVGSIVGAVGGIAVALSFLTPLAALTVPLTIGGGVACGLGAGVVVGTTGTEIALLKKNLEEAKKVIKEQEESFSLMAHWFTIPEELKRAIETLVNYEVLKQIGEDMKNFFDEVYRKTRMTIGEFKEEFKEVLKNCMKKLNKSGKLTTVFGDGFTPIVATFIFLFCLLKGNNRIILDCILINQRLAFSLMSILDLGVQAGQLVNGLAKGASELGEEFFKLAFMKFLVGLGIVIDLLNVVLNSVDIHKRPEPELTKKIKEAAVKLENVFLAIENVYNETKRGQMIARTGKAQSTTIVINSVPDAAGQEDIKEAVKLHLPDEDGTASDTIQLKRLPTKGNNWLVKVPASRSENLLLQSHLTIKEKRCVVTQ